MGNKGVVRDPAVHIAVIEKIKGVILDNGFSILGLDFSPIRGPEGNIEYLAFIEKDTTPEDKSGVDIKELVESSHILTEKQ